MAKKIMSNREELSRNKEKVVDQKNERQGLTNAEMDAISEETGAILKKEKSVQMIIPKIEGDAETVEVCINGYIYVIKRGVMVQVPKSVVDVLKHAKVI